MDDSEPKLLQRILDPVLGFFENIGTTVSLTLQTVAWLFRPPFRASQMLAAMDYIGVQSIFLVGLTGLFSGMVVALQSVAALKQFSAEANVGGIVAVSLMREVSPVFSALMITARAGSAMAAELGNMRVTEQIDAITTMGVSPVQYLLSPRLLAGVTMGPLMCMLYSTIGMIGCYIVAVAWLGGDWGFFLRSVHDFARPRDLFMGLVKGAIFGFLIASIACRHGFFASGGARGVGMATTRAVVESCVAILVANYILTQVMLGDI
ncbi:MULTISPECIES: MlaE family ABC transporter permease [Polyangium]|uniref:ABC transporter permease n=2 Tax=Polyangium TaxID=55 RepID=A0A4U1JJZ7_9BACT|nr:MULTISPECIES: ABC transporter permease [Polyangium]MDI1433351.1 ABC transporter permease [Polyangium sorediatum]TKD13082.1 ABC transporter permease [Polyangium fumosum]